MNPPASSLSQHDTKYGGARRPKIKRKDGRTPPIPLLPLVRAPPRHGSAAAQAKGEGPEASFCAERR